MRGEFSIGIPRAKERSGKVTQSFPCFCGAKSCKRIPGTSRPNVRDRIIYRVAQLQPSPRRSRIEHLVENARLELPSLLFYSQFNWKHG